MWLFDTFRTLSTDCISSTAAKKHVRWRKRWQSLRSWTMEGASSKQRRAAGATGVPPVSDAEIVYQPTVLHTILL